MLHTLRLVAHGHVGEFDPPAFCYNCIPGADVEWSAIKRAARNVNVWRYTDGGSGESEAPALGLSYQMDYQTSFNGVAGWTLTSGGTSYLEQAPGDTLYHTSNNNSAIYTSSAFQIARDMPWAFLGRLFKVPSGQRVQRLTLRWHKYQLQIVRGSSSDAGNSGIRLMRLRGQWTQGAEDTLNALEDLATITDVQQTAIDEARKTLYIDSQSISGTIGDGDDFEITFIPEPGGQVTAIISGQKSSDRTTVKNTAIESTRLPGVMWEAGPLTIRNNGGAFLWQVGQLKFAPTGVLHFGDFAPGVWEDLLATMEFNSIDSQPPGTQLAFGVASIVDGKTQIDALLSTTDTRYTPFLYAMSAYIPGGPRNGSTADVWDSDGHPLSTGGSPIADLIYNVGADNEATEGEVVILDVDGSILRGNLNGVGINGALTANAIGYNYEALENRLVTLYCDGTALFTNALVTSAVINTANEATPGVDRAQMARPETQVRLKLKDRWALLEELQADEFPCPGDGLFVSDYIRTRLHAAGEKAAETINIPHSADIQDLGGTGGTPRRFPQAPPGETWQVMPDAGETEADFLRRIVDRWGQGHRLWLNGNGTWDFFIPPTTVIAAFHGNAASTYNATAYPDRWTVLAPLDLPRDPAEFYNIITVEGAERKDGTPLVAVSRITESFFQPLSSRSPRFIGRVKKMPVVRDSSLRTQSEVTWVARSLKAQYGAPARFFGFETYAHAGLLFPGQRVSAFGLVGKIVSISGGSVLDDRWTIMCRELS